MEPSFLVIRFCILWFLSYRCLIVQKPFWCGPIKQLSEWSILCDEDFRHSVQLEEFGLGMERNFCSQLPSLTSLHLIASGGQHSEISVAYFSWPISTLMHAAAEDRANYFANLQKGILPAHVGKLPTGQQSTTLLDLMTIRAFHSKILRCFSLGTAIGYRIREGILTDIPAILVFVAHKVHKKWLCHNQCLPSTLEVNSSFIYSWAWEWGFHAAFNFWCYHALYT